MLICQKKPCGSKPDDAPVAEIDPEVGTWMDGPSRPMMRAERSAPRKQ